MVLWSQGCLSMFKMSGRQDLCTSFFAAETPFGTSPEWKTFCERGKVRRSLLQLPTWNFCKYLVGADGTVLGFFPGDVTPEDPALLAAIEDALVEAAPPKA